MEPGALGRRRRRGGAFSVAQLFANGEAGAWYDPSDLTQEKVAWRRNLLTWSEDFTNAAWTKTNVTVTAGVASWNGTLTASTLVENTVNGTHTLIQQVPVKPRVNPTVSFVAKAAGRDWVRIAPFPATPNDFTNNPVAYINLSNGTIGTTIRCTVTVTSRGSGWYFCVVTATQFDVSASTTTTFQIGLASADNTTSYLGDGVSGITFADMQCEAGPATAYQRITDFTSDFLAAFPTHGLYQDAAGTTPVTALGQPVGLVIDSKTGGLANLGVDVATGAWQNAWTTSFDTFTSTSSDGFTATTTGAKTAIRVRVPATLVVGKTYVMSFTVSLTAATVTRTGFADAAYAGTDNIQDPAVVVSGAKYQGMKVVTLASAGGLLLFNTSAAATVTLSGFSVREVPGVHAIQPTNSSRPLLDGRVNLLTRTEEFDNAAWTKNATTISANAAVAPDGTTTMDKLVETATTNNHYVNQIYTPASGATYTLSCFAKADERSVLWIGMGFSGGGRLGYDLTTGTVVAGTIALTNGSIVAVGSGIYRCLLTVTATTASAGQVQIGMTDAADATVISYAGDGTSGLYIWGADLRLATDAAYPYQRVVTATDYADVGVPRAFLFDGFDDSLYTASNMNLSGTDKVTVLAGVRKLSDAAEGRLIELTVNSAATNGAFSIAAPSGFVNDFAFVSRGTSLAVAYAVIAAPTTRVVTGIGNIGASTCVARLNGVQAASDATSQGTGNYSTAVLFIGRRNNVSQPFNGKAYQLIVRGALTDAATLAQAERYVGARTGVFL